VLSRPDQSFKSGTDVALSDTASGLIVIPARYASQRLPGKPLEKIAGRSLLERVVAIARTAAILAGDCKVVVATDDRRIAGHAADLGVEYAMTSQDLPSGTDRACATAHMMVTPPAHIINLQGDAPFIPADVVAAMLDVLRNQMAPVVTPVFQLSWQRLDQLRSHKVTAPFSGTTCIRATDGTALWFSKAILPTLRNEGKLRSKPLSPVWQHMGIYGYSQEALTWFSAMPPSHYELLEGLEQLRFLEGGWDIHTLAVEAPAHLLSGIDTLQDLVKAEEAISRFGDPFPA
jgi:3-deoxy-manno-octulosonate cytidylyltransferase (CMP-KDO synthetase)